MVYKVHDWLTSWSHHIHKQLEQYLCSEKVLLTHLICIANLYDREAILQ